MPRFGAAFPSVLVAAVLANPPPRPGGDAGFGETADNPWAAVTRAAWCTPRCWRSGRASIGPSPFPSLRVWTSLATVNATPR